MQSRAASSRITALAFLIAMLVSCDGREPDVGDRRSIDPGLSELLKSMSLSGGDMLLLEFLSIEDCATCTWTGERIARVLEDDTRARVVRVCFLACRREVEARAFQQRVGMYDTVIVDDGTIKEAMHLGTGTRYAVMSGRGDIIRELTRDGRDARFVHRHPGSAGLPRVTTDTSRQ